MDVVPYTGILHTERQLSVWTLFLTPGYFIPRDSCLFGRCSLHRDTSYRETAVCLDVVPYTGILHTERQLSVWTLFLTPGYFIPRDSCLFGRCSLHRDTSYRETAVCLDVVPYTGILHTERQLSVWMLFLTPGYFISRDSCLFGCCSLHRDTSYRETAVCLDVVPYTGILHTERQLSVWTLFLTPGYFISRDSCLFGRCSLHRDTSYRETAICLDVVPYTGILHIERQLSVWMLFLTPGYFISRDSCLFGRCSLHRDTSYRETAVCLDVVPYTGILHIERQLSVWTLFLTPRYFISRDSCLFGRCSLHRDTSYREAAVCLDVVPYTGILHIERQLSVWTLFLTPRYFIPRDSCLFGRCSLHRDTSYRETAVCLDVVPYTGILHIERQLSVWTLFLTPGYFISRDSCLFGRCSLHRDTSYRETAVCLDVVPYTGILHTERQLSVWTLFLTPGYFISRDSCLFGRCSLHRDTSYREAAVCLDVVPYTGILHIDRQLSVWTLFLTPGVFIARCHFILNSCGKAVYYI